MSHASGHLPILMHSRSDKVFRRSGTCVFKFEEGWLLWADCEQTVEEAWKVRGCSSSAMAAIQEKIHECRASLSAWGSSKAHPNTKEIKTLQKQIKRLNCEELTVEKKAEFLEVSKKLDGLLLIQEIYCHQRSRVSWLKHGDKNTKFFYSKASQRRRRNFIQGIRDQQQVWVEEINVIARVATNYFEACLVRVDVFRWRNVLMQCRIR